MVKGEGWEVPGDRGWERWGAEGRAVGVHAGPVCACFENAQKLTINLYFENFPGATGVTGLRKLGQNLNASELAQTLKIN